MAAAVARLLAILLAVVASASAPCRAAAAVADPVSTEAIAASQAAIGRRLDDMTFTDSQGRTRRLSEFAGKPLVISMVFTGCAYSCSVTTAHLRRMIGSARAALGQQSFAMLTIGFDTPVDSPDAMRAFARRYRVSDPDWHFLSGSDAGAMRALLDRLGVLVRPSPRGFDHTVQVSVIDRDGVIYRQVYGETFPTPQLIEPLKDLVLGRPERNAGALARLGNRVRLFCTVYDAQSDRYYFDYSLFVGMAIGILFLGSVSLWLLREIGLRRRSVR